MSKLYGIGAQFDSAASLLAAAEKVREAGYRRWDTHSPFPVHGIEQSLGMQRSFVSAIGLLGGIGGFIGILALILYTSKINYPLVVQGKPYFSLAATFPIMFEVTIIASAFITVGGVFLFCLLPRLYHPVFNWDKFARATDDAFFVVIDAGDPLFDESLTAKFLSELGGKNVELIEE
jgi:hypothetical protein